MDGINVNNNNNNNNNKNNNNSYNNNNNNHNNNNNNNNRHAITPHKVVVESFKEVSKSDEDYPEWFSEGKTSLIPKEGEFLSENQRPITCLNNMYKWFTSCLLAPMDQHLDQYNTIQ